MATTDTGSLAGFIAITAPPSGPDATPSPILQAMVDLAQTLNYNGMPIAQQRFAFRGPVLIDKEARGHGLYSRFNAITRQAYADIFDTGVLFVSTENPRSVHKQQPNSERCHWLSSKPVATSTTSWHLISKRASGAEIAVDPDL